jgi:Asp-tRNA(Asn)/Glu-tRNA(Gln) amidotransferase A subunit family amidase
MPEASLSRRSLIVGAATLPLFGILTRRASDAEFVYKLATGQDPTHPVNLRAQQAMSVSARRAAGAWRSGCPRPTSSGATRICWPRSAAAPSNS